MLKQSLGELEKFKELEPQMEKARQEIELNKSMLNMLNNEISHLNGEKLQLEKKLISARRNSTPSVIVEEDEEDLEEEERNNDMQQCELEGHAQSHNTDGSLLLYNKVH